VNPDGHREILGVQVTTSEDGAGSPHRLNNTNDEGSHAVHHLTGLDPRGRFRHLSLSLTFAHATTRGTEGTGC
jgi:hypothetical protein